MRELKFRAWSKGQKRMFDRVLAGPGDPCSMVWEEDRKEWTHFDEFCGEIMQYTGLKDAKGQEIYEMDYLEHLGVVEFKNGSFVVNGWEPIGEMAVEKSIVIGNVYEHRHMIPEEERA